MNALTGPAAIAKTAPAGSPKPPHDLGKATADFEAIILTEMLRSVRFGSPDGESQDQAASTMLDFGHEQMARAIAASGGLGLAKLAVTSLGNSSTPK